MIVGANLIFELDKTTLKKRVQQGMSAISKNIKTSSENEFETAKRHEFSNQDDKLDLGVSDEEGLEFDRFLVNRGDSATKTRMTSVTPDWEAEGIIVLPDDAQTLSNRISSAGVSSHCSSKKVLPPLTKKNNT